MSDIFINSKEYIKLHSVHTITQGKITLGSVTKGEFIIIQGKNKFTQGTIARCEDEVTQGKFSQGMDKVTLGKFNLDI